MELPLKRVPENTRLVSWLFHADETWIVWTTFPRSVPRGSPTSLFFPLWYCCVGRFVTLAIVRQVMFLIPTIAERTLPKLCRTWKLLRCRFVPKWPGVVDTPPSFDYMVKNAERLTDAKKDSIDPFNILPERPCRAHVSLST